MSKVDEKLDIDSLESEILKLTEKRDVVQNDNDVVNKIDNIDSDVFDVHGGCDPCVADCGAVCPCNHRYRCGAGGCELAAGVLRGGTVRRAECTDQCGHRITGGVSV